MRILQDLITLYILVVLVRCVLSFFVVAGLHGFMRDLWQICFVLTEPVLAPIRRIMPTARMGGMGMDFSPWVVLILLGVLRSVI
jgi:YggT family protein